MHNDLLRFFWKISVFFFSIFPPKEMKLRFFETGVFTEDIEVVCWKGLGRWPGPRTSFVGVNQEMIAWGVLNFYWFGLLICCRTRLVPNFVGHVGPHFFSKSPAAVDCRGNGVATKDMASRAAC